jgi:2,5-diamino-6-(ribosylamino)-4(3H)-pyrimidinone 5'-phosphate reductase
LNPNQTVQHSGLPFVLVNMAMTADGKIATANRAIHSFSSARDLTHLYELRATVDAVMCGARTIEISRSILDPGGLKFRRWRLKHGLAEYNLRVIVSGSGSIDPTAEIFKKKFSPLIVLTTGRATPEKLAQLRELADVVRVCGKKEIDFRSTFRWLHAKWNVRRLLCEGGGDLNDALFRTRLVDELHLTICPKIFGGRHAPTIAEGSGCQRLVDAQGFQMQSVRRRQDELFTVFSRRK